MHDSLSFSVTAALLRHGGQAFAAREAFAALSASNKSRLLTFLLTL
jgi:CxxC motif-containing protein (DUF1111 family)